MDDVDIQEYLENTLLTENVREWMVVVNKGLLGNKRVVYSTDKRDKAKEKFLWYRDMYPDVRFRMMTKSSFRSSYHRFPEYITDKKREELFGKKEKEVKYGQSHVDKKYVYSPTTKDVEVTKSEKPIVIKKIIKQDIIPDSDEYKPTRPTQIKKIG